MRKICLLGLAVALLVPCLVATAQDMEPKKYEGTWYLIYEIDYKMGMRDAAMDYIAANFAPAGMASDTGPDKVLIHHTGHHDMTMVWKLDGGPGDLAWETSPDDVKWLKEMMAQHGPENMEKVWQDYMAMVDDVNLVVARSWSPSVAGGDDDAGDGGEMEEDGGEM